MSTPTSYEMGVAARLAPAYLQMDWTGRHNCARFLKANHPRLYQELCLLMSPSELLEGRATGIAARSLPSIIALPDGHLRPLPRRRPRQVTIPELFRHVAPRR